MRQLNSICRSLGLSGAAKNYLMQTMILLHPTHYQKCHQKRHRHRSRDVDKLDLRCQNVHHFDTPFASAFISVKTMTICIANLSKHFSAQTLATLSAQLFSVFSRNSLLAEWITKEVLVSTPMNSNTFCSSKLNVSDFSKVSFKMILFKIYRSKTSHSCIFCAWTQRSASTYDVNKIFIFFINMSVSCIQWKQI